MEPFLEFNGVWKRFRRGQSHDTLRDLIPSMIRRLSKAQQPELGERDFWALRDLSFSVRPGEVLGIIGANGAGKSTTLKILNQLMNPSKGEVRTCGKIGSLIEVSAGFHQDLTGRQNIFLQGAILGMQRSEIRRKFDQIIEFSGIADFIDTPVKRYSSGMNARLGFSIAAHLEPDILIIDEVLSVGDHNFQQRAYAKIKSIAASGAPVVLVSHQLDRISELCSKVILLHKGTVQTEGSAMHCINAYLHPPSAEQSLEETAATGVRFESMHSPTGAAVHSGDRFVVQLTGESTRDSFPHGWQLAYRVRNTDSGADLHSVTGPQRDITMPAKERFAYQLEFQMNLPAGNYHIEMVVFDSEKAEEVAIGPRVNVEVIDRLPFWGSAQLNSRWTTLAGSSSTSRAPTLQRDPLFVDEGGDLVEQLAGEESGAAHRA